MDISLVARQVTFACRAMRASMPSLASHTLLAVPTRTTRTRVVQIRRHGMVGSLSLFHYDVARSQYDTVNAGPAASRAGAIGFVMVKLLLLIGLLTCNWKRSAVGRISIL